MTRLSAFIESVGVLGPGLPEWPHTAQVLAGRTAYTHAPTELPPPAGLPAIAVSYTHLTLPTKEDECRSRWSPYH